MSLSLEQLEMRKTGIGASEAPMVLDESPHGGRIALFMRKMGLQTVEPSPAQEMGNILEEGIAQYYAMKTGAELSLETTLRHPTYPWILATPDRWVNGRQKLLQIKLVGQWMAHHWHDTEDGIPDYVRIQVTQEMDVAGVQQCDVAALICGTDARIYQVDYDEELAAGIRDAVTSFWFDHIVAKVMPDVDGSELATEMLKKLYPNSRPEMLEATPEMESIALRLRKARHEAAMWTDRESVLEQELKKLIGKSEGVRGSDWTATWKTNSAGARPFRFVPDEEKKTKRKAA